MPGSRGSSAPKSPYRTTSRVLPRREFWGRQSPGHLLQALSSLLTASQAGMGPDRAIPIRVSSQDRSSVRRAETPGMGRKFEEGSQGAAGRGNGCLRLRFVSGTDGRKASAIQAVTWVRFRCGLGRGGLARQHLSRGVYGPIPGASVRTARLPEEVEVRHRHPEAEHRPDPGTIESGRGSGQGVEK